MDFVRALVLRLLARNRPCPLGKIELGPFHSGNFVTPLKRKEEQLSERAEWPVTLIAGGPKPPHFVITQHAIAGDFLRRQPHAGDWGSSHAVFFDRPIE